MSADVLREAARVMRERANVATPGEWVESCIGSEGFRVYSNRPAEPGKRQARPVVASCTFEEFETCGNDAVHIASWHPAVALAVADCLDNAARMWPPDPHDPREGCPDCSWLAVARAYLGSRHTARIRRHQTPTARRSVT